LAVVDKLRVLLVDDEEQDAQEVQVSKSDIDISRCAVTVEEGGEMWHRLRADPSIVTASRLASATGFDRYKSRYAYFEERCKGVSPSLASNPAVQRGILLEPAIVDVLRRFLEPCGWRVLGGCGLFVDREQTHWGATPDGFVVSPGGAAAFPLEVKSRGALDDETVPLNYCLQMHCQIYCTGAAGAFYFSVCSGQGWNLWFLRRTRKLEEAHRDTVWPRSEQFIRCVRSKLAGEPEQSKRNRIAKRQRGKTEAMHKLYDEVYAPSLTKVAWSDEPVFKVLANNVALLL
jgi:predicted phage-related endonuclease